MVDLSESCCGCGVETRVGLNAIDLDLGHAWLFGGGYGHVKGVHLKSLNPFELFDTCLGFVEETHTYYYLKTPGLFGNKRKINSSTTAVLSAQFKKFDAEATLYGMRKRGRMDNPDDEYYNMTDSAILKAWRDNGQAAAGSGTAMHEAIERFLECARIKDDPEEDEHRFWLFRAWHLQEMVLQGEVPYRTELCMFDEEHEMAGMCDLVSQKLEWAKDPRRRHWINLKDWKCTQKCNWEYLPFVEYSKRAEKDPSRMMWKTHATQFRVDMKSGKKFRANQALAFCQSLVDCKASEYFIQLNIYKWMIERNSPCRVQGMQIVAFHNDNAETVVIDVPDLQHIVRNMMRDRKQEMLKRYKRERQAFMLKYKEKITLLNEQEYSLLHHPTRPSK